MTPGAVETALREEAERLSQLGRALRDAAPASDLSPEELAALQDRNLAAFERMNAAAGAASLRALKVFAEGAADVLEAGEGELSDRIEDVLRAAAKERDALLRDFADGLARSGEDDTA